MSLELSKSGMVLELCAGDFLCMGSRTSLNEEENAADDRVVALAARPLIKSDTRKIKSENKVMFTEKSV